MERNWVVLILMMLALPTQAAVEMYYLHNDHLGTPRVVTNQAQQVVWKGQLKPFGETKVEVEAITNHRRFPGQRFDIESRLHYNYFRDYDPRTGRYVQSDPIGLGGGLNLYGYVDQNPIVFNDPLGLRSTVGSVFQFGATVYNVNTDGFSVGQTTQFGFGYGVESCFNIPDNPPNPPDPCEKPADESLISGFSFGAGQSLGVTLNMDGSFCFSAGPSVGFPTGVNM